MNGERVTNNAGDLVFKDFRLFPDAPLMGNAMGHSRYNKFQL
jgi:hypothetical protein